MKLEFRVWHNIEKCWEECLDDPNNKLCINNGMPLYRLPLDVCCRRYPLNPERTHDEYPFATLSHVLGSPDIYSIQQFTGLTDKNGKKVFDGDFIQAWDFSGNLYFKAEIRFTRGAFKCYHPTWEVNTDFGGYAIPYEVIGNIFENPELLKS